VPAASLHPPDPILGHGFVCETLPLSADEGAVAVATLVYRPGAPGPRGALLYVHGYNDYFFQTWFALELEALGFAFYALDLRRYGRSLRPGDLPGYVRDLRVYAEELDAALWRIRHRDGHGFVCLAGHSTGGLTAALYAHDRRGAGLLSRLWLNAPFLELAATPAKRRLADLIAHTAGRLSPRAALPLGDDPLYARSLHADLGHGGAWRYDLDWKRPGTLPLRAGWLRAVRSAQREVARGLRIACPVLVMCSARSGDGDRWGPWFRDTDVVIDVERVLDVATHLGPDVTTARIAGGVHDLLLSAPAARARVVSVLDEWLGQRG
jgi:alpha-beta hydrolase superfamily lysophospholipase